MAGKFDPASIDCMHVCCQTYREKSPIVWKIVRKWSLSKLNENQGQMELIAVGDDLARKKTGRAFIEIDVVLLLCTSALDSS